MANLLSTIITGGSGTTPTLVLDRNIATPSNYYNGLQFEVRATSGTAGIGLHRNGYSHVGIYHDSTNELKFNMNSGTPVLLASTGTIWGSGNDGSGSGLDADLLDGIESSRIVYGGASSRQGVTEISDWNQTAFPNAAFLSSESSTANAPTTDFTYGFQTSFHRGAPEYRTQFVTSLYGNNVYWLRQFRDSAAWSPWVQVIHSGNIGAQSVSYAASAGVVGTADYAVTAGSAPNAGNVNPFYNVTAGDGNGLRFWGGSDSYKISMGVGSLYQYGPVDDYSIKTQMNPGNTGRGFTWGNNGVTPVAALNATSGNFQVAGTIANGSIWINNGANYNSYNENIRLFDAPNGVSVIAFSASGTEGSPRTSLLGYSDRLETRVSGTWEQRIYGGYVEARGSFRAPIFYDSQNTAYYLDPNGDSRLNAITYDNLYFAADTTYGFIGRNVYADTVNGRGTDPLELNYYDGGPVKIGSGTYGSKDLYASMVYVSSGNAVIHAGNIGAQSVSYAASAGVVGTADYAVTAGNAASASSSSRSSALDIVGYGNGNMTYYQSSGTFAGQTGWAGYFVSNHGDGATYYNQTIIMPFWGAPQYSRLEGGTFRGPYTFWSTENMDAPNKSGTSYYQTNTWMQFNGYYGLYWPSHFGAHFHTNDGSTYTQFKLQGNKNGYSGIYDDHSRINGMMYDGEGNGGVYREANGLWYFYYHLGNNCMGIGTSSTSSSYKLYVNGTIYATGDVIAYSDSRKKTNIVTIDNALNKVLSMRGVFYDKVDEPQSGRQVGVIAQEVNEVLPEAVNYASDVDEYGVKYGNIVGVLIEAIKEQQAQINELKAKLDGLTN